MAQVRWTLQAVADLESITEFVAADSPHYAQLFAIDVISAVDRLAKFPRSGRIVPELRNSTIRRSLWATTGSSTARPEASSRF